MKEERDHIFSVFDELIPRSEKEKMLKQKGLVIWMTGLSGSGKTTIALSLERKLHEAGFFTQVLDGDNIRTGINNNLGFSQEDRSENIRRIAEVSKLFVNSGVITINCFVSPTKEIRNTAKQLIGDNDFFEVFVNTPIEICEARDPKGLYKKARKNEIKEFTGISSAYETPTNPDLVVSTTNQSIEECADVVYQSILPLISLN